MPFEIAVCGASSSSAFLGALHAASVAVGMTCASRDAFDHAEALLRHIAGHSVRNIVFWNVDPKVKLLVVKRLAHSKLRLFDVSPGAYAFEEMDATAEFQILIGFSAPEYYYRLDRLVLKYRTEAPVRASVDIIPNGVPAANIGRRATNRPLRRIVVSGRIAPTKFLLEILSAMRILWRDVPDAQLHVLGAAETRHAAYAQTMIDAIGEELERRVFLHGAVTDAPQRIAEFDVALIIGHHQGSPNAVLEAMAAGLLVVANDSGGTREIVIDARTGVLLADAKPDTIAAGLLRSMRDARTAHRMARAGRARTLRRYSMRAMARAYRRLLDR